MNTKDGRQFVVYSIKGFEMESYGERELEELSRFQNRFLQELPDYSNIQLIYLYPERERKIDFSLYRESSLYLSETLENQVKSRISIEKETYMVIEVVQPEGYNRPDPFRNNFTNQLLPKEPFKYAEQQRQQLKNLCKDIESWMGKNFKVKELSEQEVWDLTYKILNLDFNGAPKGLESSIDNSRDGVLRIGSKVVNIVTMMEQGNQCAPGVEKEYLPKVEVVEPFLFPVGLDLQLPHMTVVNVRKMERETGLKGIEKEVLFTYNLPDVPATKKARDRAKELQEVLDIFEKGKECVAEVALSVVVWGSTGEEVEAKVEKAKQAMKRIEGVRPMVESYDVGPIFWSCLPGNGSMHFRRTLMPSKFASFYLNDFSENYKSDSKGDLMCDRYGNFILVDGFHPALVAQNVIVVGPTGSGKSFSQGWLMVQSKLRKEINIIIDKGGTYRSLAESISMQYYEHTEENPMKFNPFACQKENGRFLLTEGKILTLRTLISILWKNKQNAEVFSNAESAVVMELIPSYYRSCEEREAVPTLKGFVNYVGEVRESVKDDAEASVKFNYFDVDHFNVVMRPYTDGIYAPILNAEDALDLSEYKNIVFDLEGVQKDPVLFPIVSMLVIELVLDHIRKYPDYIKRVFFDEAWSFFTAEMEKFIEYMYRTIRKNKGNVSIITQSAHDINSCEVGKALIQNTLVYYILNHEGKDVDSLETVFNFEPYEVQKVKSLRKIWRMERYQNKLGGRELFVKRIGVDARVVALEVSPTFYPLLTSEPSERNHFRRLKQKYSFERAIYEYVRDSEANAIPRGVVEQ